MKRDRPPPRLMSEGGAREASYAPPARPTPKKKPKGGKTDHQELALKWAGLVRGGQLTEAITLDYKNRSFANPKKRPTLGIDLQSLLDVREVCDDGRSVHCLRLAQWEADVVASGCLNTVEYVWGRHWKPYFVWWRKQFASEDAVDAGEEQPPTATRTTSPADFLAWAKSPYGADHVHGATEEIQRFLGNQLRAIGAL